MFLHVFRPRCQSRLRLQCLVADRRANIAPYRQVLLPERCKSFLRLGKPHNPQHFVLIPYVPSWNAHIALIIRAMGAQYRLQDFQTLFVVYSCLSDVCMLLPTHRPTERLSIEVARATQHGLRVLLVKEKRRAAQVRVHKS